ncbi:MAG: hypothetical protein WAV20_08880 [Blastocatellia bacterium]
MNALSLSSPRAVRIVAVLFCMGLSYNPGFSQSRVHLNRISSTQLKKESGRIDQVVPLPDGRLVVRDSDYYNETTQGIEIYDRSGNFLKKIGKFGKSSGQYFRLKTIAVGGDGVIWAADVAGRVTRFDQEGRVVSTKLIQKPGYNVHGLALDEARGAFYLSGCLAKNFYVDQGCQLVHQYGFKDSAYRRSFLDTHPEAVAKHLFPLEEHLIDIDGQGRVYAVDVPILKVSRIDPATNRVQTFPLRSKLATEVAALVPGQDPATNKASYDNAFLVDQVLVVGSYLVVSIRRPRSAGYILQILSVGGQQLAMDIDSPGRLVGKTQNGHLHFARRTSNGFEIAEYHLASR